MILKACILILVLLCIRGNDEEEEDLFSNKKIAFLFVSKGALPLEDIWREFFRWRAKPNQYSIYVHTHPDYHFPPTSFFHGKDIKKKEHVRWGGMSQVKAIYNLVEAALEDEENEYFCLMSETCIPLVPLPKWRRVMLAENRSIINACPMSLGEMEISRWHKDLDNTPMKQEYWRKSGTWFALHRRHAKVFVNDRNLNYDNWDRVNFLDEHFLPSLLAFYHLDNETTCTDGFVHVQWPSVIMTSHPKTYTMDDITTELFAYLEKPVGDHPGFNMQCSGFAEICHFTARKFSPHTKYALLSNLDLLLSDGDVTYTGNPWHHHFDKLRFLDDDATRQYLYLIDNGVLRKIPDTRTMELLHLPVNASNIHTIPIISTDEKTLYPIGAPFLSLQDGKAIKLKKNPTVWYIQDGKRHQIPDWDTFLAMNLAHQTIEIVSEADMEQIHIGSILPSIHYSQQDHHDHHLV